MYFNVWKLFHIESLNKTSGNQKQTKLFNARLPVVDFQKVQINDLMIKIIYNFIQFNILLQHNNSFDEKTWLI